MSFGALYANFTLPFCRSGPADPALESRVLKFAAGFDLLVITGTVAMAIITCTRGSHCQSPAGCYISSLFSVAIPLVDIGAIILVRQIKNWGVQGLAGGGVVSRVSGPMGHRRV